MPPARPSVYSTTGPSAIDSFVFCAARCGKQDDPPAPAGAIRASAGGMESRPPMAQ